MKIGILTWFFACNYGARAQANALYSYLKSNGYDCEFINYIPSNTKNIDWNSNNNCGDIKYKWLYESRCWIRCLRYRLHKLRFKTSKPVNAENEIDKLGYDAIVIGSDSLLNLKHPLSRYIYWGYEINSTPFIYYAPSCEYYVSDELLQNKKVKNIDRARNISVRDMNTKKVVQEITEKDISVVCDPIFLEEISYKNINISKEYILLYSFSHWGKYKEEIKEYAKENNMLIVSVGKYSLWADKSYDMASVDEWLGLIKKASIIMTDSFHGMAYALKENKQVIWVSRDDKHMKINELLSNFGISSVSPFVGGDVDKYLRDNYIDYESLQGKINTVINNSKEFLINSLRGIEDENKRADL